MEMVLEGLRVTLFGMAGIFLAIGVLIATVWLLNRLTRGKGEPEEKR